MSRPAQIQFLSRVAAAYDPVVQLMGFAPVWRAIAEVADPAPGERALDVCTGTGGAALELARCGAQVIGLDLAPGLLKQAHRKRNGNGEYAASHFVQMDARHLAFADRSFPVVTCSMALHEMAEGERVQVLREIGRVAQDRVVIAEYHVPRDYYRQLLFRVGRIFEYVESDDFHGFVSRDFRARLEQAGLVIGTARDVGGYRIWPCRVRTR